MRDEASFLELCQIFHVLRGGGGGFAQSNFGEMTISNNLRPTAVVTSEWTKVEAGDQLAPVSPPLYTAYQAGDLSNWIFDAVNAQLVYAGTTPAYYKVSASFSAYFDAASENTPIFFGVRKNGDNGSFLLAKSTTSAAIGYLLPNNVAIQAIDYFVPGDYIDVVVKNEVFDQKPVIYYLNCAANSIGAATTPPEELVLLVSDDNSPIVDNTDTQIAGAI